MALWIKNPLAILADDAKSGLVVDGTQIIECVPENAVPESTCDAVFDAAQHVVLPGLINIHHHFYQTLTRAYGPALNKELFAWLQTLYPVWANLTEDHLEVATRVAIAELLLSGCTTTVDHHYVFPSGLESAIDIQVEVARDMGIRTMLTRGSMNLSVADGGLPPPQVVQDADTILADSERLIRAYHCRDAGAKVQIALAPCSPFSVTGEVMQGAAQLASEYNTLLHTHLGETADENRYCEREFGCRPLAYLEDCGWLTARTWLAHGIHFADDEIQRIGQAQVGIAHCPGSNMLLASGLCRVRELEQAGAPVGIGIDGSASEDASNMMQEVRHAFQVQRLRYGSASVSHMDALRWATQGSAACLRRDDIGVIRPGMQADLAMFKLDELRFSGHGDPLAALVLCGAHHADRVMIGGNWTVAGGAILNLDLQALMARHRQSAAELQQAQLT